MTDLSYVKKVTSDQIAKWLKIICILLSEKDIIKITYRDISSMDNDRRKKSFILLHYLKMKGDYFNLKIYHDNIKKTQANEKLLKYYESELLANGTDVRKVLNF